MNRTERLTALLLYLQSRRSRDREAASRATAGEMATHFGVSRRTILRDLAALTGMEVPIEAVRGATGGYTLAPDYPLAPLPLSHREALLLVVALDGLQRLPVAPFGDARDSLAAKLRAMLSDTQRRAADQGKGKLALDVPERPGQHAPFLDLLLIAAQQGTWVETCYRAESGDEVTHTLFPRQLTTQNGFWYCRAWSWQRGAERTFRVDRFAAAASIAAPLTDLPPDEGLPYEHPTHPQVIARLTATGVAVAETEPHLGGRVVRNADGTGSLTFRCPPSELDYWARYFFRLGSDAHVLAPPELRARISERAEKIIAAYSES